MDRAECYLELKKIYNPLARCCLIDHERNEQNKLSITGKDASIDHRTKMIVLQSCSDPFLVVQLFVDLTLLDVGTFDDTDAHLIATRKRVE